MNVHRGSVGYWDRARLEQVVAALLMNAAKHAPGCEVELSVEANANTATLKVRDQGMGIPPEDTAHIFNRFQRSTSRDLVGGWGLGLFLCRRIVEAHGGVIGVTSTPGTGSTFIVQLPRGTPLDLKALRAQPPRPM
jgi:signal transduction histidine kinase